VRVQRVLRIASATTGSMPAGPLPVRPFTSTLRERRAHHDIPDSIFSEGCKRRPSTGRGLARPSSCITRGAASAQVLRERCRTTRDEVGEHMTTVDAHPTKEMNGRGRAQPVAAGRVGSWSFLRASAPSVGASRALRAADQWRAPESPKEIILDFNRIMCVIPCAFRIGFIGRIRPILR
jgi:hypothetical protein